MFIVFNFACKAKGLKKKVAILFGGRSPEHNISLLSAQNIFRSIDKQKYEPILIGIDKQGQWHQNDESLSLMNEKNPLTIELTQNSNPILISQNTNHHKLISADTGQDILSIDVLFPVLHGNYGEDGSVQGFAKLANLPCVGCGIIGSAVGMDKDMMKRILRDAGIKVAEGVTVRHHADNANYNKIVSLLGAELFIKPANLGSSIGVEYVENEEQFWKGLRRALQYDRKVLIEKRITGREIECAVLGNESPQASIPGEIIPKDNFYSFENKYVDEHGAKLKIPAELSDDQIKAIQTLSIKTFTVLECRGMARVDMFFTPENDLIINEINTIPGFTNISMYPKLWEYSGKSQTELISELIDLAIEEHRVQNNLLDQ